MDLTPRTNTDGTAKPEKTKRRLGPTLIVVLALVFGGVVVTKFLTSAIDYYCNVDEVGARTGCEGTRRMRVQGVVEQHSVKQIDGATTFVMAFNGKKLPVRYAGDPGGVFQECIPVVAHGRVVNGVFESDRIEVKHSNQYVQKNKARMDKANKEAAACSVSAG
jgi:cytochrome c-type biogenesis protein CcmE